MLAVTCPVIAPFPPLGVGDIIVVEVNIGVGEIVPTGVEVNVGVADKPGVKVGVADNASHAYVVMICSKTADSAAKSKTGGGVAKFPGS